MGHLYAMILLVVFSATTDCRAQPILSLDDAPTPLVPARPRSEPQLERVRAAALVAEARILYQRGELPEALRGYQRASRLDPGSEVILRQIVPLALELGRIGEATRYAVLLADVPLDDAAFARQAAMLLTEQQEYRSALTLYERAVELLKDAERDGSTVLMRFEMARLCYLTEQYEKAADSLDLVRNAIDNPAEYGLQPAQRDALLARPEMAYTLMAECYLEAGRPDPAAEMFRRAAEQQPKEWLELHLARVDFEAGRRQDAIAKLRDYFERRLRFAGSVPYELFRELLAQGAEAVPKDRRVLDEFDKLLDHDPSNPLLKSVVADLQREAGNLKRATELYQDVIRQQPTLDGYRALIDTLYRLNEDEEVLNLLGRAVTEVHGLDPLGDEVLAISRDRQRLQRLFSLGRKRIEAGGPLGDGVAAGLGLLATAAEEYQTSDEFFEKASADATAAWELFLNWGLEMLLRGQQARAAHILRTAIELKQAGDQEAAFQYYLAAALQLSGQTEEALKAARRAAELRGDLPAFQLRPAWILYQAQRYPDAEQAYQTWMSSFEANYTAPGVREAVRDARFVLSNIFVQDHRLDEAEEWLQRVLDEFPRDTGAMNDLGYLLADRGKSLQRALRMIQQAIAAEPENAAYRDSLGWVLYRLGNYQEAVVQLKLAAEGNDPDPIILEHLGDALLQSGENQAAVATWQRALEVLEVPHVPEQRVKIEEKIRQQNTE